MSDNTEEQENPRLQYLKDAHDSAIRDCSILYRQIDSDASETCMCWGWEFNDGWNRVAADLSYDLEALNLLLYPKYKVRIQADQMKEKYGDLRVYHSTHIDPPWWLSIWQKPFDWLAESIRRHVRFCYTHVVDKSAWTEDVKTVLTEEQYKKETSPDGCRPSNVDYYASEGAFWKIAHYYHAAEKHSEPTVNILMHKLMTLCFWISRKLDPCLVFKPSRKQQVMAQYASNYAERCVRHAEQQAAQVCELCGMQIGTDWSPSCQTIGWIRNICQECADKQGVEYYIGRTVWKDGKIVRDESKKQDGDLGCQAKCAV